MQLSCNGCKITIDDTLIKCSYPHPYDTAHWQITLNDMDICYTEGKKEHRFNIDGIKEFQFEMGNGGQRYADIPSAIAYVVLKADPDPQDLFHFFVPEKYILLNQTKAHEFCSQVLNYIGERYDIPVVYKLSVDTKKKLNTVAMIPVLIVLMFILLWLRIKYLS